MPHFVRNYQIAFQSSFTTTFNRIWWFLRNPLIKVLSLPLSEASRRGSALFSPAEMEHSIALGSRRHEVVRPLSPAVLEGVRRDERGRCPPPASSTRLCSVLGGTLPPPQGGTPALGHFQGLHLHSRPLGASEALL